ncbi:hypothetical protein [Pelagicoccus sp. SDUM812003]|uniref:hypothetical protein n=1 Tax=Pelagicoccus sp. SDUM812003 TaxID=3041267 RepID=UPI00280DCC2F|nr:hypothetical protein [Pelagicoccus sp. SDUM812003]MDQ8203368.1 hypothetical protein [Pelagicoccus sp. SDUM812003]
MGKEEEERQIAQLLQQMGASQNQAVVMARQLSKRADQISSDEGCSRFDALRRLLEMVKSGREGNAYEP